MLDRVDTENSIKTNSIKEMTEIVYELVKHGTTFKVQPTARNDGHNPNYYGEYYIFLTGGY